MGKGVDWVVSQAIGQTHAVLHGEIGNDRLDRVCDADQIDIRYNQYLNRTKVGLLPQYEMDLDY